MSETQQLPRPSAPVANLVMVPHLVTEASHRPASIIGRVRRRRERDQPIEEKGGEAEEVAALILRKLAHAVPEDHDLATDTLRVRSAFLRHRFTSPLRAFERADRFYGHL